MTERKPSSSREAPDLSPAPQAPPKAAAPVTVVVNSKYLREMFQNVRSELLQNQYAVYTRDSTIKFVESLYQWLAVEPNVVISLPGQPGSRETRDLQPYGYVMLTDSDLSALPHSNRALKDLNEHLASRAKKSVISSTCDEIPTVEPLQEMRFEDDVPPTYGYAPSSYRQPSGRTSAGIPSQTTGV